MNSFSQSEIEKLMGAAKDNFINFGSLQPVLIFKNKGQMVVKLLSENKDEQINFICSLIEQNLIKDYVMIIEGWAAPKDKESESVLKQNKSLEECSNKKEIILLQHSSVKTDSMYMCEITRNGKEFLFSGWNVMSQPASIFSGAFQSLFLKTSARNN